MRTSASGSGIRTTGEPTGTVVATPSAISTTDSSTRADSGSSRTVTAGIRRGRSSFASIHGVSTSPGAAIQAVSAEPSNAAAGCRAGSLPPNTPASARDDETWTSSAPCHIPTVKCRASSNGR